MSIFYSIHQKDASISWVLYDLYLSVLAWVPKYFTPCLVKTIVKQKELCQNLTSTNSKYRRNFSPSLFALVLKNFQHIEKSFPINYSHKISLWCCFVLIQYFWAIHTQIGILPINYCPRTNMYTKNLTCTHSSRILETNVRIQRIILPAHL